MFNRGNDYEINTAMAHRRFPAFLLDVFASLIAFVCDGVRFDFLIGHGCFPAIESIILRYHHSNKTVFVLEQSHVFKHCPSNLSTCTGCVPL
jgi:hypothetical protein